MPIMSPRRRPCLLASLLVILAGSSLAIAQDAPRRNGRGPETYQDRQIADVMSFRGADWLLRRSRDQEEQPDRMLDALKIEPGMTVADVGAGVGFHSLKLAERVGPGGLVYASDVQPQMLAMLARRAQQAGVSQIVPVLATQGYTGLPPGRVDLILMVDVYHEMSDPEASLAGLRAALKPGGRLVLVEFRGEDPTVPIRPEHKMTVAQARREVEPAGFRLAQHHDFLPWQHILIFETTAGDEAKETPAGP